MSQVTSTDCYIEEYKNERGQPSGRLREKVTGRKVDLGHATEENFAAFMQFLRGAQMMRGDLPDLFTRNGDVDRVVIRGEVDFDAPDEIRYLFNDRLEFFVA